MPNIVLESVEVKESLLFIYLKLFLLVSKSMGDGSQRPASYEPIPQVRQIAGTQPGLHRGGCAVQFHEGKSGKKAAPRPGENEGK